MIALRLPVPVLTCLLWAFCLCAPVLAQPAEEQPPPQASKPETDFERLIYLPYKNLKAVLDSEKATVFIPYAQFLKLWEAYRPKPKDAKPPVAAVLTQAKYTGTVERDTARISAELTLRVLGKPWVELPVDFGDAAIGKITSPENKVLLQARGNGKYSFLIPEPGEHTVQLDLVARVHTAPDGKSLDLTVPPASVTTVDLTVPAADQVIELHRDAGGKPVVATLAEAAEGTTHVTAQLGATSRMIARWHPRVSMAPVMELLASVQTVLDVRVADGLVHTHGTLTWQVQRGQLEQLRVLAPADARILDVTSSSLRSWKVATEEKQQVLTVDLLGGDLKTITLEVHTERPLPEGPFSVAGIAEDGTVYGIHATGGVRESGVVVLSQGSDLTVAAVKQSGVLRVESSEAPEALRRPEAQFYRFYSPKFDLQILVKPVEPRLLVEHSTTLTIADDELRLDAVLHYAIERAGIFELRLNVPKGVVIDRVDSPALKEFQVPAGQDELIVSLKERTQGALQVTIAGHRPLDPQSNEPFPLPILEPANVERETGTVRVLAPEAVEIVAEESDVRGAQSSREKTAREDLPDGLRQAAAWTYTRRPLEIPVRVTRRPTRLSASVGTVVHFRQDVVDVNTTVNFLVEYAGVDTFRLAIPQAVASTVQIESGNPGVMPIRQQQSAEPENGWVTWTVVFQRELTGIVPILVRYNVSPQKAESTSTLAVSPIRVLPAAGKNDSEIPLASLTGEVTVLKDRSLSISAEATALEPIDVRDLKVLPQDGSLAYRYFHQPEQLDQPLQFTLTATLHEIQKVAATVVLKAAHEVVVTEEPSALHRSRFLVKTSERQRLPIELPADAEPLDAQVAGRKVDLEVSPDGANAGRKGFFLNVARTTQSDEPFVISVVFRMPFNDLPLKGRTGGEIVLRFPKIPMTGTNDSVPVLELRTAVWVPKEYHLVGRPEGFSAVYRPWIDPVDGVRSSTTDPREIDNWFGQTTSGLVDFVTAGHAFVYEKLGTADELRATYWPMVPYAWILSSAVFLMGVILGFTTWQNRLTFLLVAAFVGVLVGLYYFDLVLHAVSAARWGLLAVAVFWLLRSLQSPRQSDIDLRIQGAPIAAVIPPPGLFEKPGRA